MLVGSEILGASLQPELVSGNENGATVTTYNSGSDKKAMELATSHCAKYKKRPQITSVNRDGTSSEGSIVYACI